MEFQSNPGPEPGGLGPPVRTGYSMAAALVPPFVPLPGRLVATEGRCGCSRTRPSPLPSASVEVGSPQEVPVMARKATPAKPGPEPETLVLPGPWEDVASRAIRTKKPASGFPERETPKRKARKKRATKQPQR